MSVLKSLSACALLLQGGLIFAKPSPQPIIMAAAPTTCVTTNISSTGDQYWKDIQLTVTNHCATPIDFQNATISYKTQTAINTSFWGNFSPLPYPDNALTITSQQQPDGLYLATLNLHFPTYYGSNTALPVGQSFVIEYGSSSDGSIPGTSSVYLQSASTPVTGSLVITNNTPQPTDMTRSYALMHISMNGQALSDVQVPWNSSVTLSSLAIGAYTISPENALDNSGNTYMGSAVPSHVTISANQTMTTFVTYNKVTPAGNLTINVEALPEELSGYTRSPSVIITQNPSGSAVTKTVTWGQDNLNSQLLSGATYTFLTIPINFNGYNCVPSFTPSMLVARSRSIPSTHLSYQCIQVAQDVVTLNIQGAPSNLNTMKVTLTPNNNTAAVTQTVNLNNGFGSSIVNLTDGVIYTISTDAVSGYTTSFSPQPLTATANASATITLTQIPEPSIGMGRMITYIPGWKTPPSAQSLADAGYTHVLIAFGVFDMLSPGSIAPAFDTVTPAYIASLHQVGIKVILSIGGASTSLPNTSVDFDQVLNSASSPAVFQQNFINSFNNLKNQYGFDGFDIDIEHGLNGSGTFTNPQGDIAVLASIINTMYAANPNLLITMAPQTANVSATSGFDGVWGNYSSLIMQTHAALEWVGVQVYNTGCVFGINQICYGDSPNSPDLSVAMAVDLLADWPAKLPSGQSTGFQPYIAQLSPSQVVLGYPAPNSQGASDGSPVKSNATIKRAFQCLMTGVAGPNSCDTYLPPKVYGQIGGAFNWEVTYDQDNNFKFATGLKNCVVNGICG